MKPYREVECYQTNDGVLHSSEADAQEHAETVAGQAIQLLLEGTHDMGAQMSYRLTCLMISKHREFTKALSILTTHE